MRHNEKRDMPDEHRKHDLLITAYHWLDYWVKI